MSTTAEINAYLNWRTEREGKTVDVSPEAYERHQIVKFVLDAIREGPDDNTLTEFNASWAELDKLVDELDELEKEN